MSIGRVAFLTDDDPDSRCTLQAARLDVPARVREHAVPTDRRAR